MPDDLIHARVGFGINAGGARRQLLRNQGSVVYDLYLMHYGWIGAAPMADNEVAAIALSTRTDDQVNDETVIGFDDMTIEEGIFAAAAFMADRDVEGGLGLIGAYNLAFSKPYTIPWLSVLFNIAVATPMNIGCDIWFVRRVTSAMDKASLVARLGGGRARTE